MLFSAAFKTHPSAQGKILRADWTKLFLTPFSSFLKRQNIIKTIIFRRFGSTIYLLAFAKHSEKQLDFFADFRCA
jgi:hypothetical protein